MRRSHRLLFPLTPELRHLLSRGGVVLVHDDGVYLSCRQPPRPVIRSANGNQGLDPGRGDDFVEDIPDVSPPDWADMLEIVLTTKQIKTYFSGPAAASGA